MHPDAVKRMLCDGTRVECPNCKLMNILHSQGCRGCFATLPDPRNDAVKQLVELATKTREFLKAKGLERNLELARQAAELEGLINEVLDVPEWPKPAVIEDDPDNPPY